MKAKNKSKKNVKAQEIRLMEASELVLVSGGGDASDAAKPS